MKEENLKTGQVTIEDPIRITTVFDESTKGKKIYENIEEEKISHIAVLFCHGMGQQVPYETITSIAEALEKGKTEKNFIVAQSLFGEDLYARVQGVLENEEKEKRVVHIYEAYWAPFTEGQITFIETIKFLFVSAWRALSYSIKSKPKKGEMKNRGHFFRRWIFGDFQNFKLSPIKTSIQLLLTMLGLSVLIVLFPALIAGEILLYIKGYLNLYAGICLAFIFIFFWYKTKQFLKGYPGDVAIYVSSHELNRFYDVRKKIKDSAYKIAKHIYSATDTNGFLYKRVILVGHSLGSVVAYDTLNELINSDNIVKEYGESSTLKNMHVLERTKYFITFGSPLNKTAFIFRTQMTRESKIREALAASKQPMIVNHNFRPQHWINIFNKWDFVSSKLTYYDLPDSSGIAPEVENMHDDELSTLINKIFSIKLEAHSKYWESKLLTKQLNEAIFKS